MLQQFKVVNAIWRLTLVYNLLSYDNMLQSDACHLSNLPGYTVPLTAYCTNISTRYRNAKYMLSIMLRLQDLHIRLAQRHGIYWQIATRN
jgi:hypothetical protein